MPLRCPATRTVQEGDRVCASVDIHKENGRFRPPPHARTPQAISDSSAVQRLLHSCRNYRRRVFRGRVPLVWIALMSSSRPTRMPAPSTPRSAKPRADVGPRNRTSAMSYPCPNATHRAHPVSGSSLEPHSKRQLLGRHDDVRRCLRRQTGDRGGGGRRPVPTACTKRH